MKLSDYKGEKAMELLADLIDPVVKIAGDPKIATLSKSDAPEIKIVQAIIKDHPKEVIAILAAIDGEDPKDYAEKVTVFSLPKRLLEIVNDPEVKDLFTSQGQGENDSGSATEVTTGQEK